MVCDNVRLYKLSIITINRNNAIGLRKTIESVINQTVRDFEYLVIDGASTDNSVNIIREFKSEITYWISEADGGIYNAMNKGIKQASGEYCLFLNSGDYLYNEKVIEEFLKEDVHHEIISCSMISSGQSFRILCVPPREVSLFTFTRGSLLHPSTFIHRNLFIKYGYYSENYNILSDWKFFLEVLIIHNCSYTTKNIIISVFESKNGISSISSDLESEAANELLIKHFPRINMDYFLMRKVEYEYFQNIFNILNKNRILLIAVRPLLRFINHFVGGRNKNERLISMKKINHI
jgi:glycosyltransferase involved in cell wall biosynthesis